MSSQVLTQTNGSKPHSQSPTWKRQSIRQFFSSVNWEDHPPEVQQLKASYAAQITNQTFSNAPLSIKLTVQQFFNAVNWEDAAIAATPTPEQLNKNTNNPNNPNEDTFTLDDFSDLF